MRQSIKFLLGHEPRELSSFDPTMTVLDYLRIEEQRTGTKEGCAEGDCGACTIVVGSLEGEKIRYQAVNSCIQFLPTLDGRQLISVEDLPDPSGALQIFDLSRQLNGQSQSHAPIDQIPARP